MEAMVEKSIPPGEVLLVTGNHRVDGGRTAARKLLQAKRPPTAMLASNDLTAIGAISAIYESGLTVPHDISVVGFDDIEISRAYNPPLTTIRLSRCEIATRAFFTLYVASNGRPELPGRASPLAVQHMISTELIVRKSSAPPPAQNRTAETKRFSGAVHAAAF